MRAVTTVLLEEADLRIYTQLPVTVAFTVLAVSEELLAIYLELIYINAKIFGAFSIALAPHC